MSTISLARLRGMTRDEVSWRTRQAARIAGQRVFQRLRPSRWQRDDLRTAVADGVLDPAMWGQTPALITESQWRAAHAELAQVLRTRTTRFALDPRLRPELRDAVLQRWPRAAAAAARADSLLAGRYDLLGYGDVACGAANGSVDWHLDPVHHRRAPLAFWADVPYLDPAMGDHKVIWELNRHQHWLRLGRAWWLTGDERYRGAIVAQLYDWLAANPPLVGINWASMLEIALRAISWTWGLHFLLADEPTDPGSRIPDPDDNPWLVDMLIALDRQLTHVERNLSLYFSPNTHLTGEALALYVVGVALPELAASSRWADTGRRILLEEIDRQIHADGGHAERSTHYQRYTLDFYLLALIAATRDGDVEAAARFADAAERLAVFTRTIADDTGRLPLIGDDDGGLLWPLTGRPCHDVRDSLGLAAVLLDRPDLAPWGMQEELFWLAGRRALDSVGAVEASSNGAGRLESRTLADTGYVVVRDASGNHAVFDAGRHGFLNGGHAHAGALALTLTLGERPLLVDPGTSTYTVDARIRDRLRSSMSHNTVTLDDRSQAIPSGPFHWHTRVDAHLAGCCHNPAFDWAEAFHDGYAPLRHRRTLLRTAESGWLVVDEVLGTGLVTASTHWHFDPAWTLQIDAPGRLKATHVEGGSTWLLYDGGDVWLVQGDDESGLGWYAPVYGTLQPTWTARVTRRASAPCVSLTWLAATHGSRGAPVLERLVPAADAGGAAIAARVIDGPRTAVFLLRPGEPASRETRGCGVLAYQTDARLLHYAEAGRLLTLDVIDASHALALRDGWISLAASEPVRDLHLSFADDTLDLQASAPPPQLRIQGAALGRIRRIRLNHREMPAPMCHPETLIIDGVDWPTAVHQLPEGASFAALP
jgi:hypothetical protein